MFWVDETGEHGLLCAENDHSSGVRWIFNLANHLPDISVSDFIDSLEKFFNVTFFFNSNLAECRILCKNDIINDNSFVDYTENTISIREIKNPENVDGFEINISPGSDDYFNDNYQDIYEPP